MVKALFDTNILIDYLNAVPEARTELQRYAEKAVSIITWMEVMVGANHDLEAGTRSFLSGFDIIAVDEVIAERAVSLRRSHRIKLPDAVIWATAQGARHAARHAQHKGFSGRRSRRSGALQPVTN